MPKRPSPTREWQQKLVGDYYDYKWKELLEPLYQDFQRWKAGERSHADMDRAIHRAHKGSQDLYSLFGENRETLASWIQLDKDWFGSWLASHPAPEGIRLIPNP
ncbi:MAG: hypothetical protein M1482_07030 [Chloroflexi bacterium]|nr:hypothetical protein [Chloroflexota bacterium]